MKNFMMLFVGADYHDMGLSPEEIQAKMGKWFAWNQKMMDAGIVKGGNALHPEAKRIAGPTRTVSDGPFVESKELIGGYYVIEVASIEDAIKVAEDYPDYNDGGSVEIREVMVFDQ